MEKENQPNKERKAHPRSTFTPDEDELLTNLVDHFGDDNWEEISSHIDNRNMRQCKDRWFNYLSPRIKNAKWTPEEDSLLEKLYLNYGPKWVKISHKFKGRTDINIKNRYLLLQRHKNKNLKKSNKKDLNENESNSCKIKNDDIFDFLVDIPEEVFQDLDLFNLYFI